MSRKASKKKEKQSNISAVYNYPQPYEMQPMMNPYPMQGGMAPNDNSMFFFEPVPIKKRNRGILPVLKVITWLVSLVLPALVIFLLKDVEFIAGILDKVKDLAKPLFDLLDGTLESTGNKELFSNVILCAGLSFALSVVFVILIGIAELVVLSHVSQEINLIASEYDHKNTPYYCMGVFFSIITLGLYGIVYFNNLSARIGSELKRRNIKYRFDEATYWGWGFFGALLLGIGPIIYYYKFYKALKMITDDYNVFG